jgi:hypothetical protein
MAYLFDDFQKFGKEHIEVVTTSSSFSLAKTACGAGNPGSHRRRDRGGL